MNMQYVSRYQSPLGEILIVANNEAVIGLWFVDQKYYAVNLDKEYEEEEVTVIKETKRWLDIYFSGKIPDFKLPICFTGTKFQNEVWEILCSIPYGKTMTYGEIANILANRREIKRMSAQAVGSAVGHNRIAIIVPCHRVIGSDGSLVGYAGGIDKKSELLKLESGKC